MSRSARIRSLRWSRLEFLAGAGPGGPPAATSVRRAQHGAELVQHHRGLDLEHRVTGGVHSDGVLVLGHEIHFENPDDEQCFLHCACGKVALTGCSPTSGPPLKSGDAWLGIPMNGESMQKRRSGDERETPTHDVERHGHAAPGT